MKPRHPLSNAEEEPFFLAADEGRENFRDRMKSHVMARFAAHGKAIRGTVFDLGVFHGAPSAMRVVMDARRSAEQWCNDLYPETKSISKAFSQDRSDARWRELCIKIDVDISTLMKARKSPANVSESELIEAALDAGMELGLQTLPAKARKAVDVAAARKVARKRLMQGAFRKNLAALEESQRGLAVLLNASRDPALTILKDADRLADAFGLNSRQAATLVRETRALVEAGKETAAIKRAMAKRVQQAIEARAELLADELGREAIGVTQSALFEQAKKQGLLEEERHLQEWVTRHDDAVCEICDELDGQRVEIGEPFESGITGEQYDDAHAHPRCRCKKRIVTVRTPSRETRRRAA